MERCKRTLGGLVLFTLLFSCRIVAQQFPYGVWLDKGDVLNPVVYDTVRDLGMNTVIQYADGENAAQKNILSGFNLIAVKGDSPLDAVSYYSNGYYTKWEGEDITENTLQSGIKANFGNRTIHNSQDCWTSGVDLSRINTVLLNGPDYRQDKKYKLQYLNSRIDYTLRINVAAKSIAGIIPQPTDPVCKIDVIFKYIRNGVTYEILLPQNATKTLYAISFNDETFQTFDIPYYYPPDFGQFEAKMSGLNQYENLDYDDTYPGTGIEFRVTWYGNKQLYIDYFEVFDQTIGIRLVDLYPQVVQEVGTFVNKYQGWDNINYYFSKSEPQTLDNYTPMKIVDEILQSLGKPKGIAEFYPQYNGWRNGDRTIFKFKEMANPEKIMMEFITFVDGKPIEEMYEYQRDVLQEISEVNPDFWYESLIAEPTLPDGSNCWLYLPTPEKLNASLMLSLAHGAKGLVFWKLAPSIPAYEVNCGATVWYNVILNNSYQPNQSIYNYLKNNLSNRLRGTLGQTLLGLDYTGNYINIKYDEGIPPKGTSNSFDYLLINCLDPHYNWHSGFLNQKDHPDNKYFLLTNLKTTFSNQAVLHFTNNTGYKNLCVRDVENNSNTINTTLSFNETRTFNIQIPPGEGYLFQVAPVVKYGGKLVYNETVIDGSTLNDDMSIENGATLTVNGTYNAKANITVKNGGKIIAGQNASINFDSGKKLIVEGIVEVKGTSENNNLTIIAGTDQAILVKSGSSFTLNYCTILAPHTGIETETGSQSYVNISNTHITAARTGISLIGNTQENGIFTTPPSVIYKCNITTSLFYGISAANYTSILVKENTLVNCGITMSNVAAAFIQINNISTGTNLYQPGIFFNNSGGYIRNNTIKNRVNGIFLANSSPDIGGNLIENNYLHGIYIGSGSFPNMVGLIQTNPPTYYSLAGYNIIRNNGNDTRSGGANDGSEIYFSYSDAHLGTERNPGCNQISDDRTSTSSMNTILLLGGNYGNEPHFLDAIYNFWGTTTPTSNRFGIATNFTPYTNSLCAIIGGEEEKIVLKTSDGLAVDTIYAAEGVPENITELESVYSEADKLYATGVIADAQPLYEQIVAGNYTTEEKLPAYNKLYAIGNLLGEDETYFNSLQSIFEEIANNEADTLIKKMYSQNAINCDVSKEEYLTAINKFDNIIQQNPNSEEAVYAEIDIITTALNLDTTNTSLGKISNGKYLVKGTSDYLSKINDLISSKFGITENEKEKIIPKEYSLYQNYPNPFNPSTTIKFDLPNDGLVQLEIFDILGRRISTIVNEYKSAGSYEHQIDASSLASGVYIYKIQAGSFINSKKMILLK